MGISKIISVDSSKTTVMHVRVISYRSRLLPGHIRISIRHIEPIPIRTIPCASFGDLSLLLPSPQSFVKVVLSTTSLSPYYATSLPILRLLHIHCPLSCYTIEALLPRPIHRSALLTQLPGTWLPRSLTSTKTLQIQHSAQRSIVRSITHITVL